MIRESTFRDALRRAFEEARRWGEAPDWPQPPDTRDNHLPKLAPLSLELVPGTPLSHGPARQFPLYPEPDFRRIGQFATEPRD